MDKDILQTIVSKDQITIKELYSHGKASECYVSVQFVQDDGFTWDTYVPYVNRRAGLFLESEIELAAYLKSIKPYFTRSAMEKWAIKEKKKWKNSKAYVTK